jgi:hypothetical protein
MISIHYLKLHIIYLWKKSLHGSLKLFGDGGRGGQDLKIFTWQTALHQNLFHVNGKICRKERVSLINYDS